ncbi:MAG: sulfite exporter TauE/SafE family protein [bacterium]
MINKTILDVKGMHCRSCEIILEKNIGEIRGVNNVKANSKRGIVEIETERKLEIAGADFVKIEKAIISSGYSLGREDKKHFFSRNQNDYIELLASAVILFAVYELAKWLGIFDLNISASSTPGLLSVLLIGLTAGISTCMALIGGLVLGISSNYAEIHPEATPLQKFKPHIFFNAGRLLSYIILGGLIGLIGSTLKLSSSLLGIITVILGFVMLFLGFKIIGIFPKLNNKSIVLPKSISKMFGLGGRADGDRSGRDGISNEYSHRGALITGALTFFVPCGFTQAMQLYAVSTGSFWSGALIMGAFALGTLPGIIGIGGLTSAIKGSFARYFFKFAGLVVISLAIFNMSSGYRLSGINLTFPSINKENAVSESSKSSGSSEIAKIENGKQIIEMTQDGRGYSPRQFTIKKGVPVTWKINSVSQFTCAAYISMPSAGISEPLTSGENILEFTPTKTGKMPFTCSMGMYTGVFNVVD